MSVTKQEHENGVTLGHVEGTGAAAIARHLEQVPHGRWHATDGDGDMAITTDELIKAAAIHLGFAGVSAEEHAAAVAQAEMSRNAHQAVLTNEGWVTTTIRTMMELLGQPLPSKENAVDYINALEGHVRTMFFENKSLKRFNDDARHEAGKRAEADAELRALRREHSDLQARCDGYREQLQTVQSEKGVIEKQLDEATAILRETNRAQMAAEKPVSYREPARPADGTARLNGGFTDDRGRTLMEAGDELWKVTDIGGRKATVSNMLILAAAKQIGEGILVQPSAVYLDEIEEACGILGARFEHPGDLLAAAKYAAKVVGEERDSAKQALKQLRERETELNNVIELETQRIMLSDSPALTRVLDLLDRGITLVETFPSAVVKRGE